MELPFLKFIGRVPLPLYFGIGAAGVSRCLLVQRGRWSRQKTPWSLPRARPGGSAGLLPGRGRRSQAFFLGPPCPGPGFPTSVLVDNFLLPLVGLLWGGIGGALGTQRPVHLLPVVEVPIHPLPDKLPG